MRTLTYHNVLQRIDDITDLIDTSSMLPRLKRLIYKAALESMAAQSLITKHKVLDVIDGLAEKPCDLIRLLRVHPYKSNGNGRTVANEDFRNRTSYEPTRLDRRVGTDHDSRYIKPSWVRNGKILISYYAVPMIEYEGKEELAISMDQLDYCAYEAVRIVLRDEVGRGNVAMAMYQLFEDEAGRKFNVAVGNANQLSIDDIESMAWFNRNAQFFNLR